MGRTSPYLTVKSAGNRLRLLREYHYKSAKEFLDQLKGQEYFKTLSTRDYYEMERDGIPSTKIEEFADFYDIPAYTLIEPGEAYDKAKDEIFFRNYLKQLHFNSNTDENLNDKSNNLLEDLGIKLDTFAEIYMRDYNNLSLKSVRQGTPTVPSSIGINKIVLEKANDEFAATLNENPKDSLAHYKKGITLLNLNKYDEAIKHFDHAIALNTNLIQAYLQLSNLYLDQEQASEAIKIVDKIIVFDAENTSALIVKAACLHQLGNYEDSLYLLKKVNKLEKENYNVFYYKAKIFKEIADYRKALEEIKIALKIRPDSVKSSILSGEIYLKQSLYEEAILNVKRALYLQPQNEKAYRLLHEIYRKQNDVSEMINNLEQAIDIGVGGIEYRYKLIDCYLESGFTKNAEDQLRRIRAIEIEPSYAYCIYEGKIYESFEKITEAELRYLKAIEIDNSKSSAYLRLDDLYFAEINKEASKNIKQITENILKRKSFKSYTPNYDKIIDLYKSAINANPDSAEFLIQRASYYEMAGKPHLAKNDLEIAIKNAPENLRAHIKLANHCFQNSQIEDAGKYADAGLKINAEETDLLFIKALIKLQRHQFEDANEKINQIIDIDPAFEKLAIIQNSIEKINNRQLDAIKDFANQLDSILSDADSMFYSFSDRLFIQGLQELHPSGNHKKAKGCLLEYLEYCNSGFEKISALLLLSILYSLENNKSKAIDCSEEVLNIDPDNTEAILLLATIFLDEKQYDETKELIDRGLEIDPQNSMLYFLNGRYHDSNPKPDHEKALKYYSKAFKKEPEIFHLELHRKVDVEEKKVLSLERLYTQFIDDPKLEPIASWGRASFRLILKKFEKALNDINAAIQQSPIPVIAMYYLRSDIFRQIGLKESADKDFELCQKIAKTNNGLEQQFASFLDEMSDLYD